MCVHIVLPPKHLKCRHEISISIKYLFVCIETKIDFTQAFIDLGYSSLRQTCMVIVFYHKMSNHGNFVKFLIYLNSVRNKSTENKLNMGYDFFSFFFPI